MNSSHYINPSLSSSSLIISSMKLFGGKFGIVGSFSDKRQITQMIKNERVDYYFLSNNNNNNNKINIINNNNIKFNQNPKTLQQQQYWQAKKYHKNIHQQQQQQMAWTCGINGSGLNQTIKQTGCSSIKKCYQLNYGSNVFNGAILSLNLEFGRRNHHHHQLQQQNSRCLNLVAKRFIHLGFQFQNISKDSSGKMSDEQKKAQTASDDGNETIFGKILKGEIPCKFIYEDDLVVAFDDINPVAPVHFLVIPRKTISMLSKSTDDDELIMGRMLSVARKVAEQKGIDKDGYRTVINNGRHGCQSVYHLHLHVIGGRQLGWPPC